MGIPDNLIHLPGNLYAGQEEIVRIRHGTTDWFQIGEGLQEGYIMLTCVYNLHAEYIMRNARLEEAQAEIKISRRNINNLRYTDDTTLTAEREKNKTKQLKRLLMKEKEETEKAGLKLNIQKTKIMAYGPITSWRRVGHN